MNKIYPNTEVEVVSTSTDGDFTHTQLFMLWTLEVQRNLEMYYR